MIEPWVLRGVAVVLTILSFMVVWSECLFFIKEPVLSIFAVFINLAKENYDYAYIEVRIPYSLYLAHIGLRFFKIAFKMLCKIASQSAHPEKESCLLGTAVMAVFTF